MNPLTVRLNSSAMESNLPTLFSPRYPCWNYLALGDKKSGKSFNTEQILIDSFLKEETRPRAFIINYAERTGHPKDYKKFMRITNGKYVEVDPAVIKMNPFDLTGSEVSVRKQKIEQIIDTLTQFKKIENQSTIEKAVEFFYKESGWTGQILHRKESISKYIKSLLVEEDSMYSNLIFFKELVGHFSINFLTDLFFPKVTDLLPKGSLIELFISDLVTSKENIYIDSQIKSELSKVTISMYENNQKDTYPDYFDFVKEYESIGKNPQILNVLKYWAGRPDVFFIGEPNFEITKENDVQYFYISASYSHELNSLVYSFIINQINNIIAEKNDNKWGKTIKVYENGFKHLEKSNTLRALFIDDLRSARKKSLSIVFSVHSLEELNNREDSDFLKLVASNITAIFFTGHKELKDSDLLKRYFNLEINPKELIGLGMQTFFNKEKNKSEERYRMLFIYPSRYEIDEQELNTIWWRRF